MPPAIVDSEDEGDNDLLQGSDTVAEAHTAKPGTELGSTHGNHEQSTGSTERIRREIHNAERALFATTEQKTRHRTSYLPNQSSSASPAMQRDKRRSNSIAGPQSSAGLQKRTKRSQTTKTYGSKHRIGNLPDDEGTATFEELMQSDQSQVPDVPAPSVNHAAEGASGGAPQDSLRAQFAEHEPTPMFDDTGGSGSTVPDTSADKRRIQACLGKLGEGYAVHPGPTDVESHESSSLPLSAFEYTQSIKGNGEQHHPTEAPSEAVFKPSQRSLSTQLEQPPTGNESSVAHTQSPVPNNTRSRKSPERSAILRNEAQIQAEAIVETGTDSILQAKPRSSPVVQIHPQEVYSTTSATPQAETGRKVSTRKRRVDDADRSEPLSSDDRAIGLPKERYVPRLSRRRATAALVEPADFSIMPEKAVKAKRTKTDNVTARLKVSTMESGEDRLSAGEPSNEAPPTLNPSNEVTTNTKTQTSSLDTTGATESTARPSIAISSSERDDTKAGQHATEKEEAAFKKPAARPQSSAKGRRAHTTIFEDNVDYIGPQRSQNLKQQQVTRALALEKNEKGNAPRTTQRRSRVVASSDDEDEIVVTSAVDDTAHANTDPVPAPETAKRGRGRPAKPTAPATTTAIKPLTDPEDEPSDRGNTAQPKKRGRGRPSKAFAAPPMVEVSAKEHTSEPANELHLDKTAQSSQKGCNGASKGNEPTEADTGHTPAGATVPTPSPEKPAEDVLTPKQGVQKTSTASHSPIKSSSKVPLRVGLSKRHRIAPLLRMTKPTTR